MALTCYLNNTDLASHSIYTIGLHESWRSSPKTQRTVTTLPGRMKSFLSRLDASQGRALVLPIEILTYTVTTRQTEEDWIKGFLRQSVTFKWTDGVTTREIVGTLIDVTLSPRSFQNNTILTGSMTLLCGNPLWQATSDTTLGALGNSDTAVALGNAPSEDWSLAVTVAGGADPRTLTVTIKNGSAVTLHTLALGSLTIGSNTVTISAALSTVKNNTTDVTSSYTGGFPAIDPKDAPTIRVVASSGTATGVLTHRKRYY